MQLLSITPEYFKDRINTDVSFKTCVYKIRKASGITFVTLRNGRYLFQGVYVPELCEVSIANLCEGAYIQVSASVKEEARSEYGFELTIKSFTVLSTPTDDFPFNVSRPELGASLDEIILHRSASIKHLRERAIIAIRSAISFGFAQFMQQHNFIEIHTPKILPSTKADDYISVRYFDKNAVLAHSPALYKIMAVGGLDFVYEIGAGYSQKHGNSLYSLNEFTRLDFECSYADSHDIQVILNEFISYITSYLSETCKDELKLVNSLPTASDNTPAITHKTAMELLGKSPTQPDLDPTDCRKLSQHAKEVYNCDYIYVTNLPSQKRGIYERDDSGFVLLLNGIEVASGGEHISDYKEQCDKLVCLGKDPDSYAEFLSAHKYALPPLGGGAIGLERFCMALLKLTNIREASFITRDLHHL